MSKKEKAKKPFFKKWWFWVIVLIVVIAALSSDDEETKETASNNIENAEQTKDNEEDNEKKSENKPINIKLDVNEELNFKLFDVLVEKVKVYEKGNEILADIKIMYTNRDYQYGDTKSFFVSTLFDVKQNNVDLEEINNAWDPLANKKKSDIYFPNAAGGKTSVHLTYKLVDAETPLQLEFTPTTETEGTETVTINLTE